MQATTEEKQAIIEKIIDNSKGRKRIKTRSDILGWMKWAEGKQLEFNTLEVQRCLINNGTIKP